MVAASSDLLQYFGDFRWWERPNCLVSPTCAELVSDVTVAKRELRALYDDAACRALVESGDGALVFPLFLGGGFIRSINTLLQLGRDLAEFPDWRERPKLLSELRTALGWAPARFEVGVQAGLRRAGLAPVIEPATSKDATRPDFVVDASGLSVGLELKRLSDPDYVRNRRALCDVLAGRLYPALGETWRGDITLELSESAMEGLDVSQSVFEATLLPRAELEFVEAITDATLNAYVPLATIGTLVMAYPQWDAPPGLAGSYGVVPDDIDGYHLLRRAMRRARQSAGQLGAVDLDLRIAVIWGTTSLLPAVTEAQVAEEAIAEDRERWSSVPLDWIVFLNAQDGDNGGVTLGLCRLPHARGDIPPAILVGLTSWG